MAARKLQADIDRVLKLVQQGVVAFEDTFEKMTNASNQTTKDKAEADLKTSIKKLQRQRDQIKTWLQSNDIKDKSALMEHRKLIETQMERFKACEKEMKTKAFSKEGLSAAQKLDPKEVAKMEMSNWVSGMVDELGQQIERTEAEVEILRSGTKKKKGGQDGRGSELEALNDRRRWHIGKLELIMRLLENGQISVDSVSAVKDDIQYYVESNTEEDFTEDDDLYESLNLSEEEDQFGMHDDLLSSHDTSSVVEESSTPSRPDPISTSHRRASTKPSPGLPPDSHEGAGDRSPTKARGPGIRKSTLDSNGGRPVIGSMRAVAGVPTSTGPAPRAVPTTLPPLRYASAAAGATTAPTPGTSSTIKSPVSVPPSVVGVASASPVPPTPTVPTPATPATSSASGPPQSPIKRESEPIPLSPETSKSGLVTSSGTTIAPGLGVELPAKPIPTSSNSTMVESPASGESDVPIKTNGTPATGSAPPTTVSEPSTTPPMPVPGAIGSLPRDVSVAPITLSPAPHSSASGEQSLLSALLPSVSGTPGMAPGSAGGMSQTSAANDPRLPSSLADLVGTFEGLKRRTPDLPQISATLSAGFSNHPQPEDAEKPSYYVPKNPYQCSGWYPKEPVGSEEGGGRGEWVRSESKWGGCDVDVLFYVFYYLPGGTFTRELKKRAWRFHKQYLTWFQRADEPVEMTDDYEAGAYVYFDWEKHWALRQKPHFTFEYKFLEDSF